MKRANMSVKQLRMTDYYWAIVPAGTKDLHAAGYDGNAFATKREALAAIGGLSDALGNGCGWEVIRVG